MSNFQKKVSVKNFVISIFRVLKMAFKAGPLYISVNNAIAIIHGVLYGLMTLTMQLFFESVIRCIQNKNGLNEAIFMAFVLFGVFMLAHMVNGLNNFMGTSYFKKVVGALNQKINIKSSRIAPISYENPSLLDDINKATVGANNSLGLLFTVTTIFSYYTPYFLFMFIYFYRLNPFLSLSLVVIFIPVALSQFVRNLIFSKLEDEIAPIRRETNYYKTTLAEKETRTLGAFSFFENLYISSLALFNKTTWKVEKKSGLIELIMKMITLAGYLGVLYIFVSTLLQGKISVGAFAAIFFSMNTMFNTMDTIICKHIANMTRNMGTINNFLNFLDMPEIVGSQKSQDENLDINLKNVCFSYPNSEKNVLNYINLNIEFGKTIAIVGENGSGKTTLVKLILGLYTPTSGSVTIGGLDTRNVSLKSLFKKSSAVFQNFQKYKMTLSENIMISEINSDDSEKMNDSLKKAGLSVDKKIFPQNYDTILSREFDGVELSGGQWQRVAIARGLYRTHDLIILDEPTAAIDPLEEANLYKKFAEISKEKTAVIVTHRIGSARIADEIVVMDRGQICEIGTHDDLIDNGGKYSNMFLAQSKWYIK
ncbi:MAG: ABC transporter ATP-binding protein/permease [Endomicrobium sp.]|jgi:ATP-binding cassette subfamily B protein|nr:ABC transporter ATP-binding protein/permease [Endomicrobium sp.]